MQWRSTIRVPPSVVGPQRLRPDPPLVGVGIELDADQSDGVDLDRSCDRSQRDRQRVFRLDRRRAHESPRRGQPGLFELASTIGFRAGRVGVVVGHSSRKSAAAGPR